MTTLKAARERAGMTQRDLADVLGVSVSYLSMMESGDRPLPTDLAYKAARRLSVGAGRLLEDQEPVRTAFKAKARSDVQDVVLELAKLSRDELVSLKRHAPSGAVLGVLSALIELKEEES